MSQSYETPRPPSVKPGDRPQTARSRYLPETAAKLANDSARSMLASSAETWTPPRPASALSTTSSLPAMSARPGRASSCESLAPNDRLSPEPYCTTRGADVDIWRRAFHAEAQECVQTMQDLLKGANATCISSRFEDWVKFDLKASAQVQQHVKQLQRTNGSLEDFLDKCAGPQEITRLKGVMLNLSQCVDDLSAARTSIDENVRTLVKFASEVQNAWEAEVRMASGLLQRHIDLQNEHRVYDGKWQTHADGRFDNLQATMDRLCSEVSHQREQITKLEGSHTVSSDRIANALKERLATLDARLVKWENTSLSEVKKVNEKVSKLESELKDKTREVEYLSSSSEVGRVETARLQQSLRDLRQELDESNRSLDSARAASMKNAMNRLKGIEQKGNVKINRQRGEVRMVAPVEFVAPTPKDSEPIAAFATPSIVNSAFLDVAEIVGIFDAPINISVGSRVPRGGSQPVWETLARRRSELVQQQLHRNGVPKKLITMSSKAGPSVADNISIQIDKAMFDVPAPATKRSNSPRGH